MEVIQRPDNLPIAGGALENLINKVSKMEMKVFFKSEYEMKNLERNYEKSADMKTKVTVNTEVSVNSTTQDKYVKNS